MELLFTSEITGASLCKLSPEREKLHVKATRASGENGGGNERKILCREAIFQKNLPAEYIFRVCSLGAEGARPRLIAKTGSQFRFVPGHELTYCSGDGVTAASCRYKVTET